MNQNTMNILEFGAVIDEIKKYAMSEQARLKLEQLKPVIDMDVINAWMRETTQACAMLDINSSIPLSSMEGMDEIMIKAEKSMVLTPQELTSCQNFLDSVKRLRSYMSKTENSLPELASYAWSMFELSELRDEIAKSIINGQVDDHASHELARIRRQLLIQEERIKQKLGDILRSSTYGSILQDPVISTRNGRYVVPVKRQYHKSFPGRVLDTSSTGSTVFMEPNSIAGLQDEINILQMEEANEVYRILSYLSTRLGEYSREILINMQAMAHYDFVFAKAKYSRSRDMKPVRLNNEGRIIIKQARHPLLGSSAVPLDFQIGADYRALIITGPNTGGKTVALKTIALLTLMVQCGLHVPVETDSEFAVFNDILADIGDGQSIEQSLSTFSAHLKNILSIIELAGPHTLVVMDEMGAGTDPAEGKGFAIAVLEEVFSKGATIAATTHFGEIKEFAAHTPGFENGRWLLMWRA
ncbi:endonuclease MutS2 [Syntrophomonas palmitatica]|uniref:endonuclease MutS2 n=1 Tax=Syntrophomonas palmitatica TaxID=402877 RepID=UPI0006D13DEF|nr:hypothetical protein [Syntrophomonas palmitatica]